MKKLFSLITLGIITLAYFSLSSVSYAASSICPTGDFANLCNITVNSTVISNIVTIMLVLGIILSLFFLIWGAIRWIMSGGDKAKLDAARGTITASIVGLIIAFLAFAIVSIITFIFTGKAITNLTLPTIVP